ncbi:MAG: PEP-CTERM sorting domain-containing protein [Acidiferrobacteraceae bacterium]
MRRFRQRLLAGVMVLGAGLALATVAQAKSDIDILMVPNMQTHWNHDIQGFLDQKGGFSASDDRAAYDTFAYEANGNGDVVSDSVMESDNHIMDGHEFTDDDGTFGIHGGDDHGVIPVPEPSSFWLMGTGLALFAFTRRRRRAAC